MVPSRSSGPSNRLANQEIWRVADASHRIPIHPACTFSVEDRGPEPPCSFALGESIGELADGQSSAGHREALSTLRPLPCQAVKSIQRLSQFPQDVCCPILDRHCGSSRVPAHLGRISMHGARLTPAFRAESRRRLHLPLLPRQELP